MKFGSLSLKAKMLWGGILLALVPVAILGAFAYLEASKGLEKEGYQKSKMLAKQLAVAANQELYEKLNLAKALASMHSLRQVASAAPMDKGQDPKSLKAQLQTTLKSIKEKSGKDLEAILFADPAGVVQADSENGTSIGISVANRPYFQAGKSGKSGVGNTLKSRLSGQPVAVVYSPIQGGQGDFKGLLAMVLRADRISKRISGTKIGKTGYGWMVDKNGFFVAHPNPDNILKLNFKDLKGMEAISKEMLAGKEGVEEYVFKGTPKVCGYAPVPLAGWSIGSTQDTAEFMAPVITIRNWVIGIGLGSLVLATILVFIFVSRINKTMSEITEDLGSGADQLASASTEIASASQSLAEGASEQAAALEETSATLEELTASSKDTANITEGANQLMNQNIAKTAKSLKALKHLTSEMDQIEKDSGQIGTVTKTIDEIAFQTNLLALNASVEAARAGAAGAGFAVVADEVRALALRAAEAAKGTQELLESMRTRIVNGAGSLRNMSGDFDGIVESATVLGEQTASITEASKEQSLGIEQIRDAASQMDQMTQRMAANSEESAASAEELAGQTEMMRSIVVSLLSLVHGEGKENHQKKPSKKNRKGGFLNRKKNKNEHENQALLTHDEID